MSSIFFAICLPFYVHFVGKFCFINVDVKYFRIDYLMSTVYSLQSLTVNINNNNQLGNYQKANKLNNLTSV